MFKATMTNLKNGTKREIWVSKNPFSHKTFRYFPADKESVALVQLASSFSFQIIGSTAIKLMVINSEEGTLAVEFERSVEPELLFV